MKKQTKKILKLRRRIAAINGCGSSFAFEADKEPHSYYQSLEVLKKNRRILTFFDTPVKRYLKSTLLLYTNKGVYRFINAVQTATREAEKIVIVFKTPIALQHVTVLGYKVLSPSRVCIATRSTSMWISAGDQFSLSYTVEV